MAKDFATVNVGMWADPDFRNLPAPAQHLYLMLWTSPGLSYCGVHDWRPGRIAQQAGGMTADDVRVIAACLEARHFLVIDEGTEEVLVRSWMRFDRIMSKPRLAISCMIAYAEVASNTLRGVVIHELQKIRKLDPEWTSWNDSRVIQTLEHPAIDPKAREGFTDPFAEGFAYGFGQGFADGLGQTLPKVCLPPTPAPTPTPTPTPCMGAPSDEAHPSRRKPEVELPTDWKPNLKHRELATRNGLDLDLEAERFRDHAQSKQRRLRDWDAGFRTWLNSEYAKPATTAKANPNVPEGWL